ncbi:hypothetical protein POTOM_037858 [Populus tomentosa]|uniref:WAT1-related protein n=1 Tax=Populus tomentosa TaxID=118781 RepID=A0A8X7YXK2_POPTO|nr:hypothetical protein POTOM_037858 [Populus tomentosa]
MGVGSKLGEAAPFTVMVIMEGCTIALTIMAKTVMSRGMSPFVFVVYTNALGTLILLPYSFLYHRERAEQPLFTLPVFLRFFFLGLTGFDSFITESCICGPKLQFADSRLCNGPFDPGLFLHSVCRPQEVKGRMEMLKFPIQSDRHLGVNHGRNLGGHLQGPIYTTFIFFPKTAAFRTPTSRFLLVTRQLDSWLHVACCIFFLCFTVEHYPERDLNAWKLRLNMELLLIVITAIFGSVVRSSVQISCTRMKGPYYVPLFQPFRIFWATFFGVGFFVNGLHYGSVIGAVISGVGYYTVSWGQMRGDEKQEESVRSSDEKKPLLQEDSEV